MLEGAGNDSLWGFSRVWNQIFDRWIGILTFQDEPIMNYPTRTWFKCVHKNARNEYIR